MEPTQGRTERRGRSLAGLARHVPWALCGLGLLAFGWYFLVRVPENRSALIDRTLATLSARGDSLEAALLAWDENRHVDAVTPASFPTVREALAATGTGATSLEPHARTIVSTFARTQRYGRVFILDRRGEVYTAAEGAGELWPACREALRALLEGRPGQLHRHPDGQLAIPFAAPVLSPDGGETIGHVVLEEDPRRWLFPTLTGGGMSEPSSEAILCRREGDEIVFVSPLRLNPAPPLTYRLPVSTPKLGAAVAFERGSVLGEFHDYRGATVFLSARRIARRPWVLAVKVDCEDVLAPFRRDVALTTIAGVSAFLGVLALVGVFAWSERKHRELALAHERARLGFVFEHASDPVLVVSPEGLILEANPRAVEVYGSLVGRHIRTLRDESHQATADRHLSEAHGQGALLIETVHRTARGERIDVEVSVRHIVAGGDDVLVALIRDISAQKRATEALEARVRERTADLESANTLLRAEVERREASERSLRESEQRFRIAQDLSPGGFVILRSLKKARDGGAGFEVAYSNPTATRILGHGSGTHLVDGTSGTLADAGLRSLVEAWERVADSGQTSEVEARLGTGGEEAWVWSRAARMGEGVAVSLDDITVRRYAEDVLQASHDDLERRVQERTARVERLNRVLRTLSDATELFVHEDDPQKLLEGVCNLIVERGAQKIAWIGAALPDGRLVPVAWAGEGSASFTASLEMRWDDGPLAQGLGSVALREGRTVVAEDTGARDELKPWHATLTRHGIRSVMALPIPSTTSTSRILAVDASEPGAFDAEVRVLFEELAAQLGFALRAADDRRLRRENERLVRTVFEHSTVGIGITDGNARFLATNPALERILGFEPREILGRLGPSVVFPPDLTPDLTLEAVAASPVSAVRRSVRLVRKDGATVPGELTLTPVRDDSGKLEEVIVFFEDTSERDRNRAELDENRRRLELAEEIGRLGYWERDVATGQVTWSSAIYALCGRERAEGPLSLTEFDAAHLPESRARLEALHRELRELGGRREGDFTLRHRDGRLVHHHLIAEPIHDADGKLVRVRGTLQDVTAAKEAELALRTTERRLRVLFDAGFIGVSIADPQGQVVEANDEFLRILGHTREDLRAGKVDWSRSTAPEHVARSLAGVAKARREGFTPPFEKDYVRPDGTRVPTLIGVACDDPERGTLVSFILDLSALKGAEAKLRKLSRAVEQSPTSIVITDLGGRIEYVNPRFSEVTGYTADEVLGKNPRVLQSGKTPRETFVDMWRTLASGGEWRGELVNRKKSGEEFVETAVISPIRDASGKTTHYVAVKEDVTQERKAAAELQKVRDQFLHAQRLEAIGRLAGGIAHDFNNVLTVIDGFTRLSLEEITPESPARGRLDQVLRAAARAVALNRQLLAFSRKLPSKPKIFDLGPALRDMEKMLRRLIGEDIALTLAVPPEPCPIKADPGQLEQVVMNLVVNARDAQPQGGTIRIEAATVDLDAEAARAVGSLAAGKYARLVVADTGTGMDEVTKSRLFEPFFTTKEPGRGTGLGLATVYGIVQQSGGAIRVESEPGKGTRFEILIPRSAETADDTPLHHASHRAAASRGTETVLLVEDEPSVRDLVRQVLAGAGYRVLEVGDPKQALATAESSATRVDLLLSDVIMPGINGPAVAKLLQGRFPGLKVLFMSGYTGDQLADARSARVLAKPIAPADLVRAVRDVLDDRQPPAISGL